MTTPMEPCLKLTKDEGKLLEDETLFRQLVDADWADDVNDRHSTTGYCFNTGSTTVSWCSKNKTIVALSSCEAEYVAATMAIQECILLKRLIQETFYVLDYPVPIHCDNESAIKLAENRVFHARTKHIETLYHFVREKVLTQDIQLSNASPKLVAIRPTGKTITTEVRGLVMAHGADAYPFTEERLNEIEAQYEEMTRGWPQKLKHVRTARGARAGGHSSLFLRTRVKNQ
ncbi:hypothetical protein F3Y22_tig00016563pilonHSYRG00148 [Hibiscus syriacus]|uniref:Uncharacterized protein n=1 Tax=Hibiscus syriacus TaxID=106335 RepID=A0A6A3BZD2_HIBSY|nr:hypothetical protein F3Y22_tig00016563pilonHSYRG00148 [Hibiscus syriacus]